jgi:hypothetical protein
MLSVLRRWFRRKPPEPQEWVIATPKRRKQGEYVARITDAIKIKSWHGDRTGTESDVKALEDAVAQFIAGKQAQYNAEEAG